jgi:hypothetical protein
MSEPWKLEETDKDALGRPTGVVRRAFEAWALGFGLLVSRYRSADGPSWLRYPRKDFPYVAQDTRIAWGAWRAALGATATRNSPDRLRQALAVAVLRGDEAACAALVDLLIESGIGAAKKGG